VFVRDIVTDPIDRAMVSSIHQIGSLMGLKTVAEFVESEEILAQLRAIGVHYGQGYALGRPQPFLS
jgi:EAL domain-containing protein (putative c-di-GMP-specific phosphodiesterase class I)